MADKFLPCNNPYDQLALLAEIVMTLRAGFGMKPAVYDESKGGLTIPDDLMTKKDTKAEEKKAKAEADAIAKKAKAEEKKAKADAKAKAEAEAKAEEPKA